MAPGQKPRDQKIAETLQAIKDCGWRSTNQFIEAFYASSGASTQSLRYQPDSTYGPERIMTAWMANVPSGDAKHHLNLSITRKAAEIMVQESTKAYHNNGLRLSTSGLSAELISSDLGLEKIRTTYNTLLPCLTLLLSTLLTAQNDYERKNAIEKKGKHDMAAKVCTPLPSLI